MGGTSSAACYLAEALAALGQEVFLLNKTIKAAPEQMLNSPESMERSLAQLSQTLQAEQQRQQILGQARLAACIQDYLRPLEANQ